MRTGAPALRIVRAEDAGLRDLAQSLLERCAFPAAPPDAPPPAIACAVSGGPDSLALLVLAIEAGLRPIAYHVDHGLRPGSADEIGIVEAAAALLNDHMGGAPDQRVEVASLRVDVAVGANLEARARQARFAVLPPTVATGHTADDQAETVLINLLRGSSTAGLAGMAAGPRHPILGVRRSETRAVCREAGLEWLEDPSNADLGPLRNRIRHQVLPSLNDVSGRDLVPVLCRQSELLADDDALLDELAAVLDPTSARELAAAPLPLARRAVRAWLRTGTRSTYPPSGAAVERVLAVAAGTALACDVGGGTSVRRRRGRLVIQSDASRTVK